MLNCRSADASDLLRARLARLLGSAFSEPTHGGEGSVPVVIMCDCLDSGLVIFECWKTGGIKDTANVIADSRNLN